MSLTIGPVGGPYFTTAKNLRDYRAWQRVELARRRHAAAVRDCSVLLGELDDGGDEPLPPVVTALARQLVEGAVSGA